MFLGEYQHSLDAKGRVILPAKYRERFAEGAVVVKMLDGCLAVYPREVFEDVAARAHEYQQRGERQRVALRSFFSGAVEAVPDKQGRIAIPQPLREFAGLQRDVVVAGNNSRLEIWDAGTFREHGRQGDEMILSAHDLAELGL